MEPGEPDVLGVIVEKAIDLNALYDKAVENGDYSIPELRTDIIRTERIIAAIERLRGTIYEIAEQLRLTDMHAGQRGAVSFYERLQPSFFGLENALKELSSKSLKEYKIIIEGISVGTGHVEEILNTLALQGYKIISTILNPSGRQQIILERDIPITHISGTQEESDV